MNPLNLKKKKTISPLEFSKPFRLTDTKNH